MNNTDVPIWEKYTLTIEEASKYFRIGEKKLRKLAEENIDAGWVIVLFPVAMQNTVFPLFKVKPTLLYWPMSGYLEYQD